MASFVPSLKTLTTTWWCKLRSHFIAVPAGQLGVTVTPWSWLALAVAWESGYSLHPDVDLRLRLPTAPLYTHAELDPKAPVGAVRLRLPWQLRTGGDGDGKRLHALACGVGF